MKFYLKTFYRKTSCNVKCKLYPLFPFRHERLKGDVNTQSDPAQNRINKSPDFSQSADEFHDFPKATDHKDCKPHEVVDNLALHGITTELKPSFPKLNLRNDILRLSRNKMVKEILDKKRRAKDRSYVSSEKQPDLKLSFSKDRVRVQVNTSCKQD